MSTLKNSNTELFELKVGVVFPQIRNVFIVGFSKEIKPF